MSAPNCGSTVPVGAPLRHSRNVSQVVLMARPDVNPNMMATPIMRNGRYGSASSRARCTWACWGVEGITNGRFFRTSSRFRAISAVTISPKPNPSSRRVDRTVVNTLRYPRASNHQKSVRRTATRLALNRISAIAATITRPKRRRRSSPTTFLLVVRQRA